MSTALFRAPYQEASSYAGAGSCALCAAQKPHLFRVEELDVIVTCPTCESAHGFEVDSSTAEACRNCGASLRCPIQEEDACVCIGCIEVGRATFRHMTEAGYVDWTGLESPVDAAKRRPPSRTSAERNLTPQLAEPRDKASFALTGPNEGWVARGLSGEPVPETAPNAEEVEKIHRTPVPSTWQDLTWPVCCNAFMLYFGEWSRTNFIALAKGSEEEARTIFLDAVDAVQAHFWDHDALSTGGALMFGCHLCGSHRVVLDYS